MNLSKILTCGLILATPLLAKPKSFIELEAGFGYESPIVSEINKVPLFLRNVPAHPDDKTPVANQGPITTDSFSGPPSINVGDLKFKVQQELKSDKIYTSFGVGIAGVLPTEKGYNGKKSIAERNYQGSVGTENRGVGRALTYIKTGFTYGTNWNRYVRPFVFAEAEYKITDTNRLNFAVKLSQQDLFIETGWDRYNSEEKINGHKLASYVVVSPRVSLSFTPINNKDNMLGGIDLGLSIPTSKSYTPLAKQMEIKENKAAYNIGLRGIYRF